MSRPSENRTYCRDECIVFRKTNEAFGALSNMAPGYPVRVNGVRIFTVEALYQACRFPQRPEVQQLIIGQPSPMTAKMVSKPYRKDSRPDWDRVRVKVMRWCLRMKLTQHWPKFSQLLLSTGDRSIVEDSRRDDFWGALPTENKTLVGMNVLGRLLMELREAIKQGAELRRVEPPAIANFLLFGEPLQVVDFRTDKNAPVAVEETAAKDSYDELTLPLLAEVAAAIPTRAAVMPTAIPADRSQGMIEGLKPYAEYKKSGLPWLDTVPKHWDMVPNRALMRDQQQVVGAKASDYTLLSLTLRGVIARDMVNPKGKFPAQFNTYKVVKPDDFVFCLFDIDETPRGVGLSPLKGMITGAYDIFSPTPRINPRFLYHYYLFVDDGKLMKPLYTGLRKTIQRGVFASLKAPLPPPDEQTAIVRFLDHANRKIDGFIRAKRKLIGLLNEQKQAIIHRAVTRGLHPNVPLKSSGIPWLGDIPKHWDVRRLRFCIVGKLTYGANAAAEFDNPDWPRYLRITDFSSDGSLRADTFRSLPPEVAKDYPVEDGDILFARSGATVGKAFLVRTETAKACYAGYLIRARPNANVVLPTFLFAFTQSTAFACWKDAIFNRATIQNIGADKYANLVVTIPPVPEQQAILDFVEKEISPLRTAIARTEREIALMQEYRTRLTADLVTGKLDVREAAAKLPDLPAEPAPDPIADEALEGTVAEE